MEKESGIDDATKTKKENILSKLGKKKVMIIAAAVVVLVVTFGGLVLGYHGREKEKKVQTNVTLDKIVNVNELSTFEAIYNGIAYSRNKEEPETIDYYTSYNATVKLGIDFSQVSFGKIFPEEKCIELHMPPITITDVEVDIGSMDYIFINKKANTETVSEEAYKLCNKDAEREIQQAEGIYYLAQQNAENFVTGLLSPFIKQEWEGYTLRFVWEERE